MKTIKQIALLMGSGILLVTFSLGTANAQEKPKGKPWKATDAAEKMKSPVKADDATIKAGKDIWTQHCKSCHGVKGLGDGAKAEKIEISCGDFSSDEIKNQSDGALYWKTTEGRKPMPSFKTKLSDQERWQVVAYMRTLAKK